MAFDRAAGVPHPARFRRARFPLSSWPARTRIQTGDPAGRRRGHYREENEQRVHWNRSGVQVARGRPDRSEEHTSELQSLRHLVCRLLLEKKKIIIKPFLPAE